jgi:hypothetical protein
MNKFLAHVKIKWIETINYFKKQIFHPKRENKLEAIQIIRDILGGGGDTVSHRLY